MSPAHEMYNESCALMTAFCNTVTASNKSPTLFRQVDGNVYDNTVLRHSHLLKRRT